MGQNKEYLFTAENEFEYVKNSYLRGEVANTMAYIMQGLCERYMKSIIQMAGMEVVASIDVMRTHSLRKLHMFIRDNISNVGYDWKVVSQADGYYFNAMYPGDDYVIVTREEIVACYEALINIRDAAINYQRLCKENSAEHKTVIEKIMDLEARTMEHK